jgi:hypothetical protein
MRDVARPEGVFARAQLDALVADVDRRGALEHVEPLVLGVVDVEWRLEVRRHPHLEQRVAAVCVCGAGEDTGEHSDEPARLTGGGCGSLGG